MGGVDAEILQQKVWTPNGGVIPVGTVTNVTFTANWEKVIEPPPVEPPEESEVNPWCEDADFSATVANTYDGYMIDEDYNLFGIVQVKTTKQAVKKTTDKKTKKVTSVTTNITATATVTDANGKKWSYSKGVATVDGVVTGLKCTTKGCPVAEFGVKVGMNGMDGAWGEYAIFGARNGMGTKGDAMLTALEAYKGKWSVTIETLRLQLDVQAKGVVKVAGNWESGAKVSASAQLVMGDGFAYVPVMVKSTKTSPVLNALLRIDGADGDVHAVRTITLLSDGELVGGGRTTAAIEIVGYLAENPVKAGAAYVGRVALNELAYPAKFTQKGLPSGLKLVKKTVYVDPAAKKKVVDHYEYVIEGVPTKASSLDKQKNVVPSHVTLTASNKYKWSGAFAFDITVVALPTWAYGTFDGGSNDGMATLTVSNVGKLSGKWMSAEMTWTLSAASYDAYYPDEEKYVAMVIGKSGKLVMTNEIEVTESGVESKLFEAWRNGWKEEPLKTLATKLKGRKVQVGEVQLTIGSSGAVTAKGTFVTGYDEKKQKDITYSASCSTVLIPTAEAGRYRVYLYFPPKSGKFDGFADAVEIDL